MGVLKKDHKTRRESRNILLAGRLYKVPGCILRKIHRSTSRKRLDGENFREKVTDESIAFARSPNQDIYLH